MAINSSFNEQTRSTKNEWEKWYPTNMKESKEYSKYRNESERYLQHTNENKWYTIRSQVSISFSYLPWKFKNQNCPFCQIQNRLMIDLLQIRINKSTVFLTKLTSVLWPHICLTHTGAWARELAFKADAQYAHIYSQPQTLILTFL
jgi:hypothetical protein